VFQSVAPPKGSDSMLRLEVERIKFCQSQVDYVRACEAASVQSGTTCTAVPLRLCIGTKALKAAVLVGDLPAHNLAAACHSRKCD
jgi:hypothetical protein